MLWVRGSRLGTSTRTCAEPVGDRHSGPMSAGSTSSCGKRTTTRSSVDSKRRPITDTSATVGRRRHLGHDHLRVRTRLQERSTPAKGYAGEAVPWFVEHLGETGIRELWSTVDHADAASRRLLDTVDSTENPTWERPLGSFDERDVIVVRRCVRTELLVGRRKSTVGVVVHDGRQVNRRRDRETTA